MGLTENPSDDWWAKNASIELLKKVYYFLPNKEKSQAIEELINDLES
ncbi:MAG: hypothetical protein ACK4WN_09155 [Aphanizomenon sp.]